MTITDEDYILETKKKTILSIHKPDLKEKIFFLLAGLFVSVPFTVFFSNFSNSLCAFLSVFVAQICSIALFAPFIEEFAKVFPLFYRHGENERSLMTLGILTGLGFGITEFLLYVFVLQAPIIARFPGVVFHAASTGITAYGIIKKKPYRYYLFSVFLHLINNLVAILIIYIPSLFIISVLNLVLTFYFSWIFYNKTSDKKMI